MAVQRDKVIASAEKLVAKGKIEPAIKEYERLLDDNPNDVNTLNRIGDLWVRINRNDEAVKVFSKIADHYAKDGFFLKAIAIFKKINKLDPSKLDIYAKLADLYAKQGLAMEAKSQYQVLADYYLKHGDPSNALGIYRKISELDPTSINVHVKLADLYSQNNQTAEALKEYDRVGRLLLKRGMLDEAVQVFRKALKIDAKNIELVESLVTALLEAKDYTNAAQIVEAALEQNQNNPRLLANLGRIQLGKGDTNAARTTLERGLAADPNEATIREALADLALRQSNPDRALEMVTPLVEKAIGRGERGAAVEMLNRILRVEPLHTPTLERLVAVYSRLNEETNILSSLSSLAEAHVARQRFEEAAKVLEKLIQREPQNSQHRTKLQFVRSQMGGVDTMPVRPKTTDIPLAMEVEEPPPAFDVAEEVDDSISLELDASEPLDLDFADSGPPIAAPPPPRTHLPSAIDLIAANLDEEAGDDLDFITEHLTEAEVFAKYGLAEKAAEHLRAILDRAPKNVTAHERLFRILLEEGDLDAARTAAQSYVGVLQEKGDSAGIEAVKNELSSRGVSLQPPAVARVPLAAVPAPAPRPPAARAPTPTISLDELSAEEEITFDLEAGPSELEFDLEAPAPETLATIEEETEITFEPELPTFDLPESEPELLLEPSIEETVEELTFDEEPALSFSEFSEAPPLVEEPSEPFLGVEGLDYDAPEQPATEDINEIDFYIGQELYEEARRKVDALMVRFPDSGELQQRRDRIESAAIAAAAAAPPKPTPRPGVPPPPRPASLSRAEIESELLSAIPDDDDDEPVLELAPEPLAAAPEPVFTAATVQEENLFADEEDFFDLAAELESELEEDDEPISLSEEEQSLEEIFKEFKKGVEQQLDSEDYDTHYNLGIAYKEMGLIDEAIGEFQLASKDPKRAVECASMLGLCFLEKGMPQLAIKWYRKGLEMPEISEDEHTGLLYDLASAYQEVGDTDNAQKAFMEVYGMNSNYRDIVTRIKALEDARK